MATHRVKVVEDDGERAWVECEYCSWGCSGPVPGVYAKADAHEAEENEPKPPSGARWTPEFKRLPTEAGGHVTVTVTQPEDPAYALLIDEFTSTPNPEIYKDDCYICRDREFAQMGLPLCYPCAACRGHVAADDTICDDCGADQQELAQAAAEASCAREGHVWEHHEEQTLYDVRIAEGKVTRTNPTVYPAHTNCSRCHIPKPVDPTG
jgi:hypothetical protein